MMKVIVVSHGDFAKELCATCEMIFGETPFLDYTGLKPDDGIETFKKQLWEKIDEVLNNGNVLLACDLAFGSPFNSVAEYIATSETTDRIMIVAGVNLPMLLEICIACLDDKNDLDTLANIAIESGRQGISKHDMKAKF